MGGWRLGHRPALDGLRGLAALLVVATHAAAFLLPDDAPAWALIPGAGSGVDLFFVLSGFLITSLLLEEHEAKGRIRVGRFYVRRARRLFPAAFAVMFLWVAFRYATGTSPVELGQSVLVVLTYTSDYFQNATRQLTLGLGHYWTLAVEEQFYLLWPPILILLLRRRVPLRAMAVGAVSLAVAVVAWRGFLLIGRPTWDVTFRADTRCDGLLLGVALAAALKAGWLREESLRRWGMPGLVGFLALALLAPAAALGGPWSTLTYAGMAVLAAVVVAGSLAPRGAMFVALSTRPIRYLGRVSYSLYLWHVPVLAVVAFLPLPLGVQLVAAFGLSLVAAALSYRWIETPFRARRNAPHPAEAEQGAIVAERV